VIARLRPAPREIFPRSRAIERFRYRGPVRGPALAVVELARPSAGVPVLRRTLRMRL
jgi:hypothetical protein